MLRELDKKVRDWCQEQGLFKGSQGIAMMKFQVKSDGATQRGPRELK